MTNHNATTSPLPEKFKMKKKDEKLNNLTIFRKIVGKLLYLSNIRHDI
jgi:hypothetical protein